ncbi:MAG TPA: DUF3501 family protein [Hyphomicrobiales bacterium]|nr:DUF3501 family protein [Kaistiaceae bacterium]HQF30059.1 DUF3501 family protein [Hyphomicrobiales bacterium]
MPAAEKRITREDVIDFDKFARERGERRKALIPTKRLRRIEVGPVATFYFENFETMLFQVQEMLHIERGGEEQIKDELHAYNPLIPQGSELVATVMFEIEDARRREEMLKRLTHVEEHLFLKIGDDKIYCKPEEDAERTSPDGKTSSVHFVRFPITDAQKAVFRSPSVEIFAGVDHENYAHMAALSPASRAELAKDFE